MKQITICLGFLLVILGFATESNSAILKVPGQHNKIQDAITIAQNGDTVLVEKGIYYENIEIRDKEITLASNYIFSGDKTDISSTILNGKKEDFVIKVSNTNPNTTITGFTIEDGSDGVTVGGKMNFRNNIVRHCSDGLDYESGSGGLCQNNIFELNSDDGIDLDDDVDIIIEKNIIRTNRDDGIEIRLQPFSGKTLNYIIRHNLITNNAISNIQYVALKGITKNSAVAYQNVYLAETPYLNCNIAGENTVFGFNPKLKNDFSLSEESMLVDKGINELSFGGEKIKIKNIVNGKSADIGAIETGYENWIKKIGPAKP